MEKEYSIAECVWVYGGISKSVCVCWFAFLSGMDCLLCAFEPKPGHMCRRSSTEWVNHTLGHLLYSFWSMYWRLKDYLQVSNMPTPRNCSGQITCLGWKNHVILTLSLKHIKVNIYEIFLEFFFFFSLGMQWYICVWCVSLR